MKDLHTSNGNMLPLNWEDESGWSMLIFFTDWSGSSLIMKTVISKVCGEMPQPIQQYYVDMDAHPALAQHLHVQRVPSFLIFKDGKLLDSFTGILPQHQLAKQLLELLAKSPKHLPEQNNSDITDNKK